MAHRHHRPPSPSILTIALFVAHHPSHRRHPSCRHRLLLLPLPFIAFFLVVGINFVTLDLTFFVAVPIALAALAIALLPPLPSPFAIALFFARHLVAVVFARIFAVTIARWQQRGNKDNDGDSNGGGGKYNNQLKRGRRNSNGDRNDSSDIQR
jgi:hypothetical protein